MNNLQSLHHLLLEKKWLIKFETLSLFLAKGIIPPRTFARMANAEICQVKNKTRLSEDLALVHALKEPTEEQSRLVTDAYTEARLLHPA